MDFATNDDFKAYCKESGHVFVQFLLKQSGKSLGTLYIELFQDICPKTVENFLKYVQGTEIGGYRNCPIHRVVKGGYIQSGDIINGSGAGIATKYLNDECFAVKHDSIGIIGMANLGQPHTASSQFYISLGPLPWLDGKRVAFGRIPDVASLKIIKGLQEMNTFMNERPVPDIVIAECDIIYEPEGYKKSDEEAFD
mmetsp:Transcript_29003/g.53297  ORF Transcript_29003/g.53297 Transcript_29003/m.53297 type:complete len:196 (-) Transcript_29003:914-1501(-)